MSMEQRTGRGGRPSARKFGTFGSCSKLGAASGIEKQPTTASELAQEDRDPKVPTRRYSLPGIFVPFGVLHGRAEYCQ